MKTLDRLKGVVLIPAALILGAGANALELSEEGIRFPDGSLLTTAHSAYAKLVTVAESGGHYDSVQAALDGIVDAAPDNRYLVWVAPGIYEGRVTMKRWVDIQGSGEGVTRLTALGDADWQTGTVTGANDAEVRQLTVENTGGSDFAIAIYNFSASPGLTHVTAIAQGGSQLNLAISNEESSSPTMTHVTTVASGGQNAIGIHNYLSCSPVMKHVKVSVSGGIWSTGVHNTEHSSPLMVDVGVTATGASTSAHGVYNSESSSPVMFNVRVSTSAGSSSIGVENIYSSSPTMTHVSVSATGGSSSTYGVENSYSSPSMINVTVTATGAGIVCGVKNDIASPSMTGVQASASGGFETYGVRNHASSPEIRNSQFAAWDAISDEAAIHNTDDTSSARLAHSQLRGGASGPSFKCLGVFDENFETLDEFCQPPSVSSR